MINNAFKSRSAYTLLELILALGISVLVVVAIASSIYTCVSNLTEYQKEIEQRQVARNVISMITSDLRAALQYKPADVTGLQDLAVSQAMVAGITGGGVDEETIANEAGENGGSDTSQADTGSEEEAMDPEDCVSCRPTMIGTERVLMIDISRLPRIDEYNPMVAMRKDPQLPSDVKGVTYFIAKPSGTNTRSNASMYDDEYEALGGLYRRQIDRAVASYSGETDAVSAVDNFTELIAPEIVEIAYRYFDGSDWTSVWDSVEQDGFPTAIEVAVVVDPQRIGQGADYSYPGYDANTMLRFTKVIHLPIAEPAMEE